MTRKKIIGVSAFRERMRRSRRPPERRTRRRSDLQRPNVARSSSSHFLCGSQDLNAALSHMALCMREMHEAGQDALCGALWTMILHEAGWHHFCKRLCCEPRSWTSQLVLWWRRLAGHTQGQTQGRGADRSNLSAVGANWCNLRTSPGWRDDKEVSLTRLRRLVARRWSLRLPLRNSSSSTRRNARTCLNTITKQPGATGS